MAGTNVNASTNASANASANANKPKRKFTSYITTNRFYVEIGGEIKASFTECSGLGITIDKDVYMEGGVNHQQRIFLKQAKLSDITLKRGMSDDVSFWNWLRMAFELQQDSKSESEKQKESKQETSISARQPGGDSSKDEIPKARELRRNIAILLFNQAGETMQSWRLIGAIPVAWKMSSLQANSSNVAIEELTLAYEGLGLEKKSSGNSGAINSGPRSDGFWGEAMFS